MIGAIFIAAEGVPFAVDRKNVECIGGVIVKVSRVDWIIEITRGLVGGGVAGKEPWGITLPQGWMNLRGFPRRRAWLRWLRL